MATATINDIIMLDTEESGNTSTKVTSKVTLLQAEEHLRGVQQYIDDSGAPVEIRNRLLGIANDLRKHNASKPRCNPTITSYFPSISSNNSK